MASRTSATDLPEKSSRSAALPAADPAFCPVPAALPARRRAGVFLVCPPLRAEVDRERDDPPERELDEPADFERDELEREDVDRDPVDFERDDPPDFERDELEREDDDRDPDDDERDPPDRPPREDPPLLPPDDSAITASSCPCTHDEKDRAGLFHARREGVASVRGQRAGQARGRSRPNPRSAISAVSPRLPRFGSSASWTATS
jgi:hypothetical protein